jgi:hypothetical protein
MGFSPPVRHSLRSHGTTRLPQEWLWWNLVFELFFFSKNLSRKFKFHKNPKRIMSTYMNTFAHLWQYLAEFFSEWETFQISYTENQNTRFMFNNFFFRKSCRLYGNVEKFGGARGRRWQYRGKFMLDKHGYTRASTLQRPCMHTHKHIIAWAIDKWISMKHLWNDPDRERSRNCEK